MGQNKIDFKQLNSELLRDIMYYLPQWLPGGKMEGREYRCSNISGGKGKSFSVNTETGVWADFASGEKGGDLISLYAATNKITQGEAAKQLLRIDDDNKSKADSAPARQVKVKEQKFLTCPANQRPTFKHRKFGPAEEYYTYRNGSGEPLFYIAKYFDEEGDKVFTPFTWDGSEFRNKMWPDKRPLYNLQKLVQNPSLPVLLVEGEKCAIKAEQVFGKSMNVVTWAGGANALAKTDFKPLIGKSVLIWPDNDEPGIEVANKIGEKIYAEGASIRLLNPSFLKPKEDIADLIDRGMNNLEIRELINEHIEPFKKENKHLVSAIAETEMKVNKWQAWNDMELIRGGQAGDGQPKNNEANCYKTFKYGYFGKDTIWFDEFHCKYFTTFGAKDKPVILDEILLKKMLINIQTNLGLHNISYDKFKTGMTVYASEKIRNEPKDWMMGLKWDGKPRVDAFFSTHLGCKLTPYHQAVSKNMWIAMVARIMSPGCKMDNMVVFEGRQGAYKSSMLKAIAGEDWFVEATDDINNKDFRMSLKGRLIVEVAELDSIKKNGSSDETVKNILSISTDKFRPPYGEVPVDFPRTCIFIGTTNKDEYLTDTTGNRRIWPVEVASIDIEKIVADREQLFAEAVHRFNKGESWWEIPSEEANAVMEKRMETDVWENIIVKAINDKVQVTTEYILVNVLHVDTDKWIHQSKRRIGHILRRAGWVNKVRMLDGVRARVWVNPKMAGDSKAFDTTASRVNDEELPI